MFQWYKPQTRRKGYGKSFRDGNHRHHRAFISSYQQKSTLP